MTTAAPSGADALPRAGSDPTTAALSDSAESSRRHLRGSSLLLAGRGVSVGLNFAVQILTVRHLSQSDYGAFAYALGVASIASSTILLGLGKALPRLLPIYRERGDYSSTFGAIALSLATVLGLGLSLVLAVHGFQNILGDLVVADARALSLLLVLIAMVPLDASDNVLQPLVAVFASPRAIFLRRQVMGPGFKLVAIAAVIGTGGDARMLAYGYVVGGLIGVWMYVAVLLRAWRRAGLFQYLGARRLRLPARELFGFSLPLLSSELTVLWRGSLAVLMLEYFHTTLAVAEYRAVLSVAGLNMIVFEACGFLFVPHASRMFARHDREGISRLYWQTALWIAVLTFPVLAMTCLLATPVTILLFGVEYAGAGTLLAVLSVGHYVSAVLGFNSSALRVHGRLRMIVASDVVAAVIAIGANVLLIPRYGAFGAAIGTAGALILHNLLTHVALWAGRTGINLVDGAFTKAVAVMSLALIFLAVLEASVRPPLSISVALVAVVSLSVFRRMRRELAAGTVFPELLRVPVLRWLLT